MIPDKVAQLIRIANAAGTDAEANNAARMACKSLLELVGKDSSRNDSSGSKYNTWHRPEPAPGCVGHEPAGSFKRGYDQGKAEAERVSARERPSSDRNWSQSAELKIQDLTRRNRDLTEAKQKLEREIEKLKKPPVCIQAKFDSKCRECGEEVTKDEQCWWTKGVSGVVCMACH